MPRRKKTARELTTDEAMQKMFPKKARDLAKREAENSRKTKRTSTTKKDGT
jgi:hypothetical protein